MTETESTGAAASAGDVLRVVRRCRAATRSELIELTGLRRSTLGGRLDPLLRRGLLVEAGTGSTGGRPAGRFEFNASAGTVWAADLGATHARLGVADLSGAFLAERAVDLAIAEGPDVVLGRTLDVLGELLTECGRDVASVWGVGIGVPGPVDFASGRPVRPPIMAGWDDFDVRGWFAEHLSAPVFVDNDVNVMAVGEHWRAGQADDHDSVFVKVGTGIGSGLILQGQVYRGARGAAGDIGHVRVEAAHGIVCRCGNTGCVEAVASGQALARQLTARGVEAADARDVAQLIGDGDPHAIHAAREAGRLIGEALASAVNLLNPDVIVVGGDLADAHDHLLAGIREVVYQRSTALATQRLRITESQLRHRAGVEGCAILAIEELLTPRAVDQAIAAERGKAPEPVPQ